MPLPTGWSEGALGDVCRVVSGATPKTGVPQYWGGEVPWITPNDMSQNRAQVLDGGERTLTKEGYASCSTRLFPEGSVIVSSRAPIGYVAIAGREMCTNQGCKTAVPPDSLDSRYLYWYLVAAKPDLEARASGTTFKEISSRRFAETRLRWPDLRMQRRIVEILEEHFSHLDAAANYERVARQRVTALRRSSLQSHFGIGVGGVPLGALVADISAGKSFGSSAAPAGPDEWGIIKVSAMTWGSFDSTQNKAVPAERVDSRYEIRTGDLLVSRANTSEYVGASVLVGETRPRLLLSDKSLRVTPRPGVSSEWLWRALQAPSARRQISRLATGTKDSMRNISQGSLRSILIPEADAEDQRRSVAAHVEVELACRRLSGHIDAQTKRSSALRQAVLAAAFEGKLTGRHTDTETIEDMVASHRKVK